MAKRIVLDANILIRAVMGKKVLSTIEQFTADAQFFTADCCSNCGGSIDIELPYLD